MARRPKAPSAAGSGGVGRSGAISGAAAAAAAAVGHSEEQAAWLGRIQYYAGREMWRKAEDKFQQARFTIYIYTYIFWKCDRTYRDAFYFLCRDVEQDHTLIL